MDETREPLPHLTPRERNFLWLMTQGATPTEAGEKLNIRGVAEIGARVRRKLNARTLAQATYISRDKELIGPYSDCGLMAGYRAHKGRHEDACPACRRAFREYTDRHQARAFTRPAQLTEPELRLLRAFDAGRTFKQVCDNWQLSPHYLARVRTSMYRKLDVSHLPSGTRYHAALEEGRARGLLPRRRGRQDRIEVTFTRNPRRWGTTDLTEFQVRILSTVQERSLSEAGEVLGMPGAQVSSHLARIYRKLGVLHHAHGERREAALKEARNRGYRL